MKKLLPLAFLLASFSSVAHSEENNDPGSDMPKDCVAKAREIGEVTKSQFQRMSHTAIFFQPPMANTNTLTVDCGPMSAISGPEVSLYWKNAFPSEAYYELLAKAGEALTGEKLSTLVAAEKACAKKAFADETEMADKLTLKAKIECHAFTRDGGSVGTYIYVRGKDDAESE